MLDEWARTWAVSDAALADLRARMGVVGADALPPPESGPLEAAVLSRVRLVASKLGLRMFRNNVGAGYDDAGNFMRWGLANDSAGLNRVLKSGDLIGVRPRVIQPEDVGKLIGQFTSWECKREGWRYRGTEREVAQLAWAKLITSLGGEARFVTSEREL